MFWSLDVDKYYLTKKNKPAGEGAAKKDKETKKPIDPSEFCEFVTHVNMNVTENKLLRSAANEKYLSNNYYYNDIIFGDNKIIVLFRPV